jgi:hypothetical protein
MTLLKKSKTSMPAIVAVALMALTIVGFSYAHWEETLFINGYVTTGTLDWQFTSWSAKDTTLGENDWHCREGFAGPPPLFWQGDKDVGNTTIQLIDSHHLRVNMSNVYPSYFNEIAVYAMNTGTIPLIIDRVVMNGVVVVRKEPSQPFTIDLDGDGVNETEIWYGNGFGTQLDPRDWSPEMSFWVHFRNVLPQHETFSFTIEIVAINWNEYPLPP